MHRLGCPPRVVMGLLLVIDLLLLPAFVIENDQFFSRIKSLIKEIRNQNVNLAVADPLGIVQRVADHPDQSAVAVLLTVVGALVDLGQVRPVGQCTDGARLKLLTTRARSFTPVAFNCSTARS